MSAIADSIPVKVVQRVRIESIDVVRGVIMILMALDHTRAVPLVCRTEAATQ